MVALSAVIAARVGLEIAGVIQIVAPAPLVGDVYVAAVADHEGGEPRLGHVRVVDADLIFAAVFFQFGDRLPFAVFVAAQA